MQKRNLPFDPQDRGDGETRGGIGVPVKGDSSSSHVPPSDTPTRIDSPSSGTAPGAPRVDPEATMVDADATTGDWVPPPPRSTSQRSSVRSVLSVPIFEVGDVLAGRYEIVKLLGEGGMGAVYKALDRELDRFVALKVIRPELAANSSMLARFKQELLLSRQVTHKNVIRIYDLGDTDGVKFITMEFVEGRDLRDLIHEKKKFTPEEAVNVMQQVCQALEAAHNVGVIHRDLKPQNIMREESGRILVMDFGLARTMDGDGMTQTGALVGTMEYMSPEQALGKELDQRSDIFTAGLILYEMLTGKMPFKADTALASLVRRTQERAIPVSDHDNSIPGALSGVVSKCLERDPKVRYQSAAEVLRDLDSWQGKRAAATLGFHANVKPWGQTLPWPLMSAVSTAVILAALAWVWRAKLISPLAKPPSAVPQVSLAILPFRNASGDPAMDWLGASLAEMLSTDVGQSARLRTVPQDRVHQVFSDLRLVPNASFEPDTLKRVADFSNANTLVWGQFAKFGSQIRIDATVEDLKHDRSVPVKIDGVDEKDIPGAVDRLASQIRENLSISPDVIKELKASSFQPASQSVAALRDYNQGIQLLRDAKNLEAVKALKSATNEDPAFALAYARLAEADSALGYDSDAEQASRKAVELSQQLPLAEKYLIEATHARIIKDNQKAIQAYENLIKSMPDDSDIESALARLYTETGAYDKAYAELTRLLQADPRNVRLLSQMGSFELMNGKPREALDPLNRALSISVQTDNEELKASVLKMVGTSYRLMNKPDDALRNLEEAIAIDQRLGLKANLAADMVEVGIIDNSQGKPDQAITKYKEALSLQREIGTRKEQGDTLIDLGVAFQAKGDYGHALENYKEALQVERNAADENYEALCLSNIGNIYFGQGDTDNALTYLQQALQLREKLNNPAVIAETLSFLGEVYTSTGQYDQALATSMRALDLWRKAGDTRGAADESHDIGLVLLYQGHLGRAIESMQDAVKNYRATGDRGTEMVELLKDLAAALAQAGRNSESKPLLEEAQALARSLKNDTLDAELFNAEGDVQRYSGNARSATSFYEQALRSATRGKDAEEALTSKVRLAEGGLHDGNGLRLAQQFRSLKQETDAHHSTALSLETSIDLAQALLLGKDPAAAQQELQTALGLAEKMGAAYQRARIEYFLGSALQQEKNPADSIRHYGQAATLLDTIRKEPGAEKLLDRSDIKAMYDESLRGASQSTH